MPQVRARRRNCRSPRISPGAVAPYTSSHTNSENPSSRQISGSLVETLNVNQVVLRVQRSSYPDLLPLILLGLFLVIQLIGCVHQVTFKDEFLATLGDLPCEDLDLGLRFLLAALVMESGQSHAQGVRTLLSLIRGAAICKREGNQVCHCWLGVRFFNITHPSVI